MGVARDFWDIPLTALLVAEIAAITHRIVVWSRYDLQPDTFIVDGLPNLVILVFHNL